MNGFFQLLQYEIWKRDRGPGNVSRWGFIVALASLYAIFFPFLFETFGSAARIFSAPYLAIAALSWGLRGAILITFLNTALILFLHHTNGYQLEGGVLGPLGCLFITAIVGMLSDMANQLNEQMKDRKKTEQRLKESEKRYRNIFDSISEGVFIMDKALNIVDINDTAARLYGYEKDELRGVTPKHLLHPDDAVQVEKFVQSVNATGHYQSEAMNRRKNGEEIAVEIRGSRIELNEDTHYLVVIRDITQRVQADGALRESEEKYRQLFDMETDAIFLIDDETEKIIEANASACQLYGYTREEFLGMHPYDFSAEPDATRYATRSRVKWIPIRYHHKKDGTVLTVEINTRFFKWKGRPVLVACVRDISLRLKGEEERRRLEAQFHEAQKMESIGTLAGGIAHDFNNLLMGIMGNVTLALMHLRPEDKPFSHLKNIMRISKSGAKLSRQILGFARGGKYESKTTDLNELVAYQTHLFSRTSKNITIQEEYAENLWLTEADQGQIEQVLLNIYVNSQQAMPEGGSIFIQTRNTILTDDTDLPFTFKRGAYVELSIRDTGIGMDEQTQKRIFEPFFTTKEKGRGTGLGLASVYGIIKNHEGYVHVISEPGKGTTMIILLPITEKEVLNGLNLPEELIRSGTGTILLVDDEETVIEVTADMIELLGYSVISANSGQKALQIYQEKQGQIDLVILDMVMPNMGGAEVFGRLKEINPDVGVLLSSGYRLDEKVLSLLERGGKDFLPKPFDMAELSVKIEAVIHPSNAMNRTVGSA